MLAAPVPTETDGIGIQNEPFSFGLSTSSAGAVATTVPSIWEFGVAVGGIGVAVAGTDVAVGGTNVGVGGIGVAVGGIGVAVAGTGVDVGGIDVGVGGIGVAVGGIGVAVAGTGVDVGGSAVGVGVGSPTKTNGNSSSNRPLSYFVVTLASKPFRINFISCPRNFGLLGAMTRLKYLVTPFIDCIKPGKDSYPGNVATKVAPSGTVPPATTRGPAKTAAFAATGVGVIVGTAVGTGVAVGSGVGVGVGAGIVRKSSL
mgnify:CR=1 FL=1